MPLRFESELAPLWIGRIEAAHQTGGKSEIAKPKKWRQSFAPPRAWPNLTSLLNYCTHETVH